MTLNDSEANKASANNNFDIWVLREGFNTRKSANFGSGLGNVNLLGVANNNMARNGR